MDDEEIPPCPYNGNPNAYYISEPSGLIVKDYLLPNAQEVFDNLRWAAMKSPPSTSQHASRSETPKDESKEEEPNKRFSTKISLELTRALLHEYRTNWDHDWTSRTRRRVRKEIAERVGVTEHIVSCKFGNFHKAAKNGRLHFAGKRRHV